MIEEIKMKFPEAEVKIHNDKRIYLTVGRETSIPLCRYLFEEKGLRFSTATGIDTRECFEILYHFSEDETGIIYTVKAKIPKDEPWQESLGQWYPAFKWIEREIMELLGIEFKNHPDPRPLLTAEDWPRGKYPLRRDYA
ncbi:hypothetical protein DRP53_00225 [candidate division WOR-3 bacterium]|uniref:NADH-quinone oxidoreductase n=1 Tax=candidate division WOR-3 bacterium TaxID=2052148 RepID=A0A660SM93_UNCW3|nr:MAG: hypothetical protein DRP53_00225 [candidate division WOR-3 bacterium]